MCNNLSEEDQEPKDSRLSEVQPPQPCKEASEQIVMSAVKGDKDLAGREDTELIQQSVQVLTS